MTILIKLPNNTPVSFYNTVEELCPLSAPVLDAIQARELSTLRAGQQRLEANQAGTVVDINGLQASIAQLFAALTSSGPPQVTNSTILLNIHPSATEALKIRNPPPAKLDQFAAAILSIAGMNNLAALLDGTGEEIVIRVSVSTSFNWHPA